MGLKTKVDTFNLAGNGLTVSDTTQGASISSAEARGEDGFVVAIENFGERDNPSCNYVCTGAATLSGIVLGSRDSTSGCVLSSLTINTSAGSAPTVSASGMEVPSAAVLTGGCTVTLPSISLSPLHHAQMLGGITFSGTGAHCTQCSMSISCDVSTAEIDGEIAAYDLTGGKMSVSATIQVSDAAYGEPTITLPSGWKFTSPLSETNPNGDFPTYSFTAESPLAADTASS